MNISAWFDQRQAKWPAVPVMLAALTLLLPDSAAPAAVSPMESVKRTIDEVLRILDDRERLRHRAHKVARFSSLMDFQRFA